MKIAVLFRGPVRPTAETAVNNIKLLTDCLSGYDVTTYLWAWNTEMARKVNCDINILDQEPSQDEIARVVNTTNYNCFKQYWVMKRAIKFINSHRKYDFIIQSRTDTKIVFDKSELPNWFDEKHYVTIHYHGQRASYVNDQIGVASVLTMYDAWNYKTFDILNEFMQKARQPEDVLDNIIVMYNVKLKIGRLKVWELDERRHWVQ